MAIFHIVMIANKVYRKKGKLQKYSFDLKEAFSVSYGDFLNT